MPGILSSGRRGGSRDVKERGVDRGRGGGDEIVRQKRKDTPERARERERDAGCRGEVKFRVEGDKIRA